MSHNQFDAYAEPSVAAHMEALAIWLKTVPGVTTQRPAGRLEAGSEAPLPAAATVATAKDDQSSAMSALAAFDPAAFQNILPAGMGVDSPLARKLIRLFVGESAKLLAEIERAGAAVDTQALFRAAHSLKSSGASVGASAFTALARGLEALARAGQTEALPDYPARLRLAYERFCEEPAIRGMLAPEPAERTAA